MNSAQGVGPLFVVRDLLTQRALMNKMRFTGVEFTRITSACATKYTAMKYHIVYIIHTIGICLNSAWLQKVIPCRTEKFKVISWIPRLVDRSWLGIEDLSVKGVS